MKTTLASLRQLRARREQKAAVALHSARRLEVHAQEQAEHARATERRIIVARDENRQVAHSTMFDTPQTGQSIQQLTANFSEFDNLVSVFALTRHSTEIRAKAATQSAVLAATVWRTRRRAIEALQFIEQRQAIICAELEEVRAADELDDASAALRGHNHRNRRD
jgi:hypothetical protein